MDEQTMRDIQQVFDGKIEPQTFDKFCDTLDSAISENVDAIILRTRNEAGDVLKYQGTQYFSVVSIIRPKPVIFAAALESDPQKNGVPAIRFRDANTHLSSVPANFKFPYRKPNWTCVMIVPETIDQLEHLMRKEIRTYIGERAQSHTKKESSSNPDSPVQVWLAIIVVLVGIVVGLYGLLTIFDGGFGFLVLGLILFIVGIMMGPSSQSESQKDFKTLRYELYGIGKPSPKGSQSQGMAENQVTCPKCGSSQITAQKRGFKVGRAVATGLGVGVAGALLAGAAGKDKIIITCLQCGHEWRPGRS